MRRLLTPETATADDAVDLTTEDAAGHAGGAAAPADDTPVAGASAVVEAATAEAAIAEVHERFGPGASIVEARRVLRGGIGGFFAKEHVQLHVAAGPTGGDGDDAPERDVRRDPTAQADIAARAVALAEELTAGGGGDAGNGAGDGHLPRAPGPSPATDPEAAEVGSPVDRLLGGARSEPGDEKVVDDIDFGTYLRDQLAKRADLPVAAPSDAPGTAASNGASDTAPVDHDTARAGAQQVQPMRWPGSHEPWSVYGVETAAQPDLATSVEPGARPEPGAGGGAWQEPAARADLAARQEPGAGQDPAARQDLAASQDVMPSQDLAASQEPVGSLPTADPSAVRTDAAAWSTTRLLHLGLPASLVHDLDVADPTDELSWVAALTDALRPVCRPLPNGPAVLVGPDAPTIAEVVDLPVARSRTWLDALGANRWRHLVIGGQGWRAELTDEPLAVSWVRTEDLPDALRCAMELGLVLGYGPQGGQLRRARPLDVALAVRELVELP